MAWQRRGNGSRWRSDSTGRVLRPSEANGREAGACWSGGHSRLASRLGCPGDRGLAFGPGRRVTAVIRARCSAPPRRALRGPPRSAGPSGTRPPAPCSRGQRPLEVGAARQPRCIAHELSVAQIGVARRARGRAGARAQARPGRFRRRVLPKSKGRFARACPRWSRFSLVLGALQSSQWVAAPGLPLVPATPRQMPLLRGCTERPERRLDCQPRRIDLRPWSSGIRPGVHDQLRRDTSRWPEPQP